MLKHSFMPLNQNNYIQKELVQVTSRPQTIDYGSPSNLTILSKKTWVTLTAVQGWDMEMKWAYFDSWSTTTNKTDFLWKEGNPSMKSIKILDQIWVGIRRVCRTPTRIYDNPQLNPRIFFETWSLMLLL